jgi:hypothetical protein
VETLVTSFDLEDALHSGGYWFLNFYSPGCSHCHDLAPGWRVSGLLSHRQSLHLIARPLAHLGLPC